MNILIVGGAGFIGSHTAERLLNTGHNVTIVDNFSTGRYSNIEQMCHKYGTDDTFKFHCCDIVD